MKKCLIKLTLICLAFVFLMPSLNANAKEYHWYCKRNKDNKQPICDESFNFIEEYGGIYLDKKHGDSNSERVIYLTFDVGYENGNVTRILDVLKSEGVKGSFFILGNVIERESELTKRLADEGHLVCNHTLTHKNLTGASVEEFNLELSALEEKYRSLTGRELAKFFRPPEGTFDAEMLKRAHALGYKTVFWSFAYFDWDNDKQMSREAAMKKILENVHNGEIMLLHPTGKTNADIMQELIRELKSAGYRFGTLDEIE